MIGKSKVGRYFMKLSMKLGFYNLQGWMIQCKYFTCINVLFLLSIIFDLSTEKYNHRSFSADTKNIIVLEKKIISSGLQHHFTAYYSFIHFFVPLNRIFIFSFFPL